MSNNKLTVVIGDSTHNTLGLIRSLGLAGISMHLILKMDDDCCHVMESRYLRNQRIDVISDISQAMSVLNQYPDFNGGREVVLQSTFDEAAEWVDANEEILCRKFLTPCRGKQIGDLFSKDEQCRLARECGLTVPESVIFHRGESIDNIAVAYPIIVKPLYSVKGAKEDIHICCCRKDLEDALREQSHCDEFLLQEFIEKEYEINCVGISTDNGVIIPGAIHKLRHYPDIVGAMTFGRYENLEDQDINIDGINRFMKASNYHGPFSVEFLHRRGKNYFMEVNFRNDGLAYVATAAGANIHAKYVDDRISFDSGKIRNIYAMNFSIDPLHIREGRISKWQWIRDFIRSRVFINACFRDLAPFIAHYRHKTR